MNGRRPWLSGAPQEAQSVEYRGTCARSGRCLAREQVAPFRVELDRPAHAQRPAEVAYTAVEGVAPDRAFADNELEIAQNLAAGARCAQRAQDQRAARGGRAAPDETNLCHIEFEIPGPATRRRNALECSNGHSPMQRAADHFGSEVAGEVARDITARRLQPHRARPLEDQESPGSAGPLQRPERAPVDRE